MGITLHAQVEYFSEPKSWRPSARWGAVSRWELGKDYELQRQVRETCHPLHPKGDDAPDFDEEELECIDQGRCWIEVERFPSTDSENPHWLSLEASLGPLRAVGRHRVLFWTE